MKSSDMDERSNRANKTHSSNGEMYAIGDATQNYMLNYLTQDELNTTETSNDIDVVSTETPTQVIQPSQESFRTTQSSSSSSYTPPYHPHLSQQNMFPPQCYKICSIHTYGWCTAISI